MLAIGIGRMARAMGRRLRGVWSRRSVGETPPAATQPGCDPQGAQRDHADAPDRGQDQQVEGERRTIGGLGEGGERDDRDHRRPQHDQPCRRPPTRPKSSPIEERLLVDGGAGSRLRSGSRREAECGLAVHGAQPTLPGAGHGGGCQPAGGDGGLIGSSLGRHRTEPH